MRDGRILTRVRRRLLLVLVSALPACLSGFSEIRVVRPDAGRLDAGLFDVALGGPDAVTRIDATDVPQPPLDVIHATDVNDAGTLSNDATDVGEDDRVDATDPADHVDVQLASDLGGALDVQCPVPLCNGVCVDTSSDLANCGGCGRVCGTRCVGGQCVRLAGVVPVVPPDRYLTTLDPRDEWERTCGAAHPGSRVCRMADVRGTPLHAEICRIVWPMRGSRANGLAALAERPDPLPDGGSTRYVCAECTVDAGTRDVWGGCLAPHAIPCCVP